MAQEKGQALTPSQREVPFKGQWLWLPELSPSLALVTGTLMH